jgi:hypothetical protein
LGTLLPALKHAARIRHLQPDDHVLICVRGPVAGSGRAGRSDSRHEVETRTSASGGSVFVWSGSDSAKDQATLLTLRVRHSDVMALADGSIGVDELRNRAQIQTYPAGDETKR